MGDHESPDDWVTAATFAAHPQALLAKSILDSAGIECWLRDEHFSRMMAGLQAAVFGGIQLEVHPQDLQTALALLRPDSAGPVEDAPNPSREA